MARFIQRQAHNPISNSHSIQYGDAVLFIGNDRKSYVRTLAEGGRLVTHLGHINYGDIVGRGYGIQVATHLGHLFHLLQPSYTDLLAHSRHETTIIQPKDLGYIAIKMGIRDGVRVAEAGTGSGGLTVWLALLAGDNGHVYSYDRRPAHIEAARKNAVRAQVEHRITFTERDIADGFGETELDALFLDVTTPNDYLSQARAALVGGGHFGALVPTMNQVIDLVAAMYQGEWFQVEVQELLLRDYKTVPMRIRPDDRMVGHTGYLIFARAVTRPPLVADEKQTDEDEAEAPTGLTG